MNAAATCVTQSPDTGLTRQLANQIARLRFEDLPTDVQDRARLCLLDWVGVTLAARDEAIVRILRADFVEAGGVEEASPVGGAPRLPAAAAAHINVSAAHALDFDDANTSMVGHPSVALIGGLLALAEAEKASAVDVITAFVGGYDVICQLSYALGPMHYNRGYHTTATVGGIAVAAACARLIGLGEQGIANAMGIAASRAGGSRGVFGTMLKPLQVGFAAADGVRAARLTKRGITGPGDTLERASGFLATMGNGAAHVLAEPTQPAFLIRDNLFKFHASCLLANAPSIATCSLLQNADPAFAVEDIAWIRLIADPAAKAVCDDRTPATGLAMKFSLCSAVALVLAGFDTGQVATFSDDNARDPVVIRLRDMVEVRYSPQDRDTICHLELGLTDGRTLACSADAAAMPRELHDLRGLVEAKFLKLASPAMGDDVARSTAGQILTVGPSDDIAQMVNSWFAGSGDSR